MTANTFNKQETLVITFSKDNCPQNLGAKVIIFHTNLVV